ncbi:MAG: hypothetical protein IH628_03445 [Proteobacteria bacterium]|nr:hypothetical protein [Pseudomonadota bacterium]
MHQTVRGSGELPGKNGEQKDNTKDKETERLPRSPDRRSVYRFPELKSAELFGQLPARCVNQLGGIVGAGTLSLRVELEKVEKTVPDLGKGRPDEAGELCISDGTHQAQSPEQRNS